MPKIPKRNKEYWQKRFKAIEKQNHGKGLKSLAYITLEYEKAEKELNDKINLWYERFAKNNDLTLAEAKKVLNAKELKEFKWSVDDYIKYAEENELNGQWVKELENASARVHIERFEALKIDMKATIEKLYSVQSGTLFKTLGKVYSDTYYRSCFEVQKAFGIGWNVAKVDENRLKKALSTPWTADGSTFSARLWSNREKLVSEVQSTITRGLMTGKTPDKMTAEISKAMGSSKRNAGRIVMTETAAISAVGQEEAYKELGVEEFEIVETLDGSTCAVCGELDGKHFPQSEYKIGVTVPPFHPWCRGCTAPYFEDMKGLSTRFARDVKTGKAYEVPNDMTYAEWKKTQDKAAEISENPLKNNDNSDIISKKEVKSMSINSIEFPIEQRNTGKGNPNAVLIFDVDLNNRQKELLKVLPEFDSNCIIKKNDVNMKDLSALTAKTGVEFAMFTKENSRLIIRGDQSSVNIDVEKALKLCQSGYRWSGHTHPGMDFLSMQPSDGDYAILECFKQENAVIYNSKGDFRTFEKRSE